MSEFFQPLEGRTLFAATPYTALIALLKTKNPDSTPIGTEIDDAATGALPPSTISEASLATALHNALHTGGLPQVAAKRVALLIVDAANGASFGSAQIDAGESEMHSTLVGAGVAGTRVKTVTAAYVTLITVQQQPDVLQLSTDLHRAEVEGDTAGIVDRITHDLTLLSQGPVPPTSDTQNLSISLAATLQKYKPGTHGNGHIAFDLQTSVGGTVFATEQFQSATFEVQSILSNLGVATANLSAITEQMGTLYLDTGGSSLT